MHFYVSSRSHLNNHYSVRQLRVERERYQYNAKCANIQIQIHIQFSRNLQKVQANSELISLYSSQQDWLLIFYPSQSLASAQLLTSLFFYLTSALCLLISFLLLLIFTTGMQIGSTQKANRITAFAITLNNLAIPLISMALIYIVSQIQDVPLGTTRYFNHAIKYTVVAMGSIMLVSPIIGYVGIVKESRYSLEANMVVTAACSIGLFVVSGLVYTNNVEFQGYYTQTWGKVMMQVSQEQFTPSNMGCYGGKYSGGSSSNYYNLECEAKSEISLIWEGQSGLKIVEDQAFDYSCINKACKEVFGDWMGWELKITATLGFTLSLAGIFNIWMTVLIWKARKSLWHNAFFEKLALIIALLITISLGIAISLTKPDQFQTYPFSNEYPEDMIYSIDNESALRLKYDLVNPNKDTFHVYGIHISEDQSQCKPDCTELSYKLTLSVSPGELLLNQTQYDIDVEASQLQQQQLKISNETHSLYFEGSLSKLSLAISQIYYKPSCPLETHQNIHVNLKVQSLSDSANGQMVSISAGEAKEIRGQNEVQVVEKDLDQALISEAFQKVIIRVTDGQSEDSMANVQVIISYPGYVRSCSINASRVLIGQLKNKMDYYSQ